MNTTPGRAPDSAEPSVAVIEPTRPRMHPQTDVLLAIAADFAFAAGAEEVEHDHLLAALLHQPDALEVVAEAECGDVVRAIAGALAVPGARAGYMPQSEGLDAILARAAEAVPQRLRTAAVLPGCVAYAALELWSGRGPADESAPNLIRAMRCAIRQAARVRMPDASVRVAAVHEAGHAVVMASGGILPGEVRVANVDSGSPQNVTYAPADWHAGVITSSNGRWWLRVMLAGRAAERLVFGHVSSGCETDLRSARQLAQAMLTTWQIEPWPDTEVVRRHGNERQAKPARPRRAKRSEALAYLITRAEDEALEELRRRRDALRRLTQALMRRTVIHRADLARILDADHAHSGT